MDVAGRCHHNSPGLKGPPFAANQADTAIINRIAKDGRGELHLARCKGTHSVHFPANAWNGAAAQSIVYISYATSACTGLAMTACSHAKRTLGQRKI